MDTIDLYFGFSLAGLILGVGAAVIILLLGVFSLKSHWWFRILNGTDRLTIKFMLWPGSILLLIGLLISGPNSDLSISFNLKLVLLIIMILNGTYLTFVFAPIIRKLENDGVSTFLNLPNPHQYLIFICGTISAITWTLHALIVWLEIASLT